MRDNEERFQISNFDEIMIILHCLANFKLSTNKKL